VSEELYPIGAEPATQTYNPDEETKKKIKELQKKFVLSRKSKQSIMKHWREAESLYAGQHWGNFKLPEYKNQMTIDMIASAIDTMIPILSTRPPKIDVIAYGQSEEDRLIAETMQGVLDELWNVRGMTDLMPEWLLDFLV
jgi:ATP:corrinoid adenosyltransferase